MTDLAAHGIDLPAGSDTHNSIGGLLFSDLGRLPKRGDKIDVNGYELRVEPVRENPSLWYGSASVATFRTSRRRRRSRDQVRDDGVPPSATAIRCTENAMTHPMGVAAARPVSCSPRTARNSGYP